MSNTKMNAAEINTINNNINVMPYEIAAAMLVILALPVSVLENKSGINGKSVKVTRNGQMKQFKKLQKQAEDLGIWEDVQILVKDQLDREEMDEKNEEIDNLQIEDKEADADEEFAGEMHKYNVADEAMNYEELKALRIFINRKRAVSSKEAIGNDEVRDYLGNGFKLTEADKVEFEKVQREINKKEQSRFFNNMLKDKAFVLRRLNSVSPRTAVKHARATMAWAQIELKKPSSGYTKTAIKCLFNEAWHTVSSLTGKPQFTLFLSWNDQDKKFNGPELSFWTEVKAPMVEVKSNEDWQQEIAINYYGEAEDAEQASISVENVYVPATGPRRRRPTHPRLG